MYTDIPECVATVALTFKYFINDKYILNIFSCLGYQNLYLACSNSSYMCSASNFIFYLSMYIFSYIEIVLRSICSTSKIRQSQTDRIHKQQYSKQENVIIL